MAEKLSGTVVKATGSWYEVLSGGERLQCRIRGKLRLKGVRSTNPVVVGDEVELSTDEQGGYVISDKAIELAKSLAVGRLSEPVSEL
jgi:ribosome biogenesis GTPase